MQMHKELNPRSIDHLQQLIIFLCVHKFVATLYSTWVVTILQCEVTFRALVSNLAVQLADSGLDLLPDNIFPLLPKHLIMHKF